MPCDLLSKVSAPLPPARPPAIRAGRAAFFICPFICPLLRFRFFPLLRAARPPFVHSAPFSPQFNLSLVLFFFSFVRLVGKLNISGVSYHICYYLCRAGGQGGERVVPLPSDIPADMGRVLFCVRAAARYSDTDPALFLLS